MFKTLLVLFSAMMIATAGFGEDAPAAAPEGYRCISNGFRLPLKWNKATQPRLFSRFRRKAMADLKGKLILVFPTFYMSSDKPVREVPFPNDVAIQAGIEPVYKMSNRELDSSPRIVGETATWRKGDPAPYKLVTVDLGDTVIKKGDWFGIWVALENLDGEKMVPLSRLIGSSQQQLYECASTTAKTSLIDDDFIRTAKTIPLVKPDRNWEMGYAPAAILAKTDYRGDVWGIIGSSIPEGYYDIRGDQYGDENANLGYADKFLSTKLGAPSVNLSKGSDKLDYCAKDLRRRLAILKLCGANKVHIALGGNDISGRIKLNKMKEDCLAIVKMVRETSPGIEVVGSTILPHSSSTDHFQTLKGQTPRYENAGDSSERGRWNHMLRTNPGEVGFDAVHELCSYVESGWEKSDSLWTDRDGAPATLTPDGTHPTCAGSAAIAEHAYQIDIPAKPEGGKP